MTSRGFRTDGCALVTDAAEQAKILRRGRGAVRIPDVYETRYYDCGDAYVVKAQIVVTPGTVVLDGESSYRIEKLSGRVSWNASG